ncbi:hypothetical protein QTP86_024043, partial [Hemibagrus guttatus]
MNPGLHVHGPSGPIVAQLGGSVLLPCFIENPLPLEGLQVEWRKKDSDSLVSLFQQGGSRLDLQSHVFKGRVDFFSDELSKGNFSILLKNVLEEDAGGYRCKVNTSQDSSEVIMEVIRGLVVTGSDRAVFAFGGEDVTLNCSVDSHVPVIEIEEVTWKRMDRDPEILVLLYQDSEIFPDSSHESYQDRVDLFSSEILKGNFSLKLKDVKIEDKGEFTCEIHTRNMSGRTTVLLQGVGYTTLHIAILVLCSVTLLLAVGFCGPVFNLLRKKDLCCAVTIAFLIISIAAFSFHYINILMKVKGKGARTIGDLRVIVLPLETVYFFAWLALQIYDSWGLVVTGSDRAVFASEGEDVTLNCSVDPHVPASEIEEVTWKRTDRDPEILVLLYQDSEIFPDSSHESYQDRVDLFFSEIPKGNFSLNLKDVKMEDKGEFTCEVHTRNMSGRTTVLLQGVGFAAIHIAILVLCSVALLLAVGFCGPVFNLLRKKVASKEGMKWHIFLILCPNICMFLSFCLWSSEGFLSEVIACSAVSIMRPVILMKTSSYLSMLPVFFGNLTRVQVISGHIITVMVIVEVVIAISAFVL